MIAFDNKTQYAVSGIPTSEIYGGLLDFARAQGVPVFKEAFKEQYGHYPNLHWCDRACCVSVTSSEFGDHRYTWITIDQFIQACKEYKDNQPITMKIGDYTAEVLDGFVAIGCQKIPFEQVKELNALILKAEANATN